MLEQVEDHQIWKEQELQQTKAKIISKQKRDERRYEQEVKKRNQELKDRNDLYEEKVKTVNARKKGI